MDNKQLNQDVMGAVARKGKPSVDPKVEKAKQDIKQIMVEKGISPEMVVRGGKMAQMAISNKTMYPAMVQMAVREGLVQPNEIGPKIDYQFLAGVVSAGKIAQMIIDEGGL
jgi:hypothetical protein